MQADRWVRIMAEYGSDGVWDREGCSHDADDLPISRLLRSRLLTWADRYQDYEPEVPGGHPFDLSAFAAEGLEIARAVKVELPDWTVIYYDEAARERLMATHPWEYEVEVSDAG